LVRTPLFHLVNLETIPALAPHRIRVWAKLENLQVTGSFKPRGAVNCVVGLGQRERARGIAAASTGNHALAVTFAGEACGVGRTVIVMPSDTLPTRIRQVELAGAEVEVFGDSLRDAYGRARHLAAADKLHFVHGYDDRAVIAGHGTVGLEMVDAVRPDDVVIVPLGGGALAAGVGTALKAYHPRLTLIGVRAEAGAAQLAECVATKPMGDFTAPLVRDLVDEVVTVSDEQLKRAVGYLSLKAKQTAEGPGAGPLAAVLEQPERFAGRRVVLIVTGGNIDPAAYAQIVGEYLTLTGRTLHVAFTIPQQALTDALDFCKASGARYELATASAGARSTRVRVRFTVGDEAQRERLHAEVARRVESWRGQLA
jgi:threonine dehydratase